MIDATNYKHIVIKVDDILKALDEDELNLLREIVNKIRAFREDQGKKVDNFYAVINQDEDYFQEIVQVLKNNDNWDWS